MKNKIVTIGTLCLVLVLGLVFVGCDDFQKVEFGSVGKPSVTATPATGAGRDTCFIVEWNAVGDASTSYTVIFQPTGKKAYDILDYGQNSVTYKLDGSASTTNKDVDKWSAEVWIDKTDYDVGTGKIGVKAEHAYRNDKNSSIGWSATVTLK